MSKEIKQKADELVEMFRPLVSGVTTKNGVLEHLEEERTIKIVAVAILHQKRLIEELVLNSGYVSDFYRFNYLDNIKMQKKILTELKSRL